MVSFEKNDLTRFSFCMCIICDDNDDQCFVLSVIMMMNACYNVVAMTQDQYILYNELELFLNVFNINVVTYVS